MKKQIAYLVFFGISFLCNAQGKEQKTIIRNRSNGIIESVEFSEYDKNYKIPVSSSAFLKDWLKSSSNDQFKKIPHTSKRKEFVHEHYDQYYNGVKVEGAGYNFHYKNGKMYFANGNYVKIENLNTSPGISAETAKELFARYKSIPLDSVSNFISELIIKKIRDTPMLVFRIYLYGNHKNNTEVGFIDAQTGEILLTEPAMINYSATGTFATRYNDSRQGITQNYNGSFHLADSTRNAVIHTWNLDGSTNITDRAELSDNDNNWTAAEHSASENNMGLDVHWTLQQIYDHLNNIYGINSFDDNGFPINAHIHYGTRNDERDNAGWSPSLDVLVFGDGAVKFRPVASVDAVAHEYGHGITDFQIGWAYSGDGAAFHEGLSDIWGAILEQRIRPNSVWQIGEQIDLAFSCLRNIQNTNDQNTRRPIAGTYLSTQYNNNSDPSATPYIRGGVFSHWFYLLTNGDSGTNDLGNNYSVLGVNMDMAENLVVEAVFNNYLDNTTTYPDIRTAMVNAARTLCSGQNSLLVNQVENAWYAVGVGTQPTQMSLTGPTIVCSSGSTFTVNNPPSESSVTWNSSPNISRVSPQGSNPCTFSTNGSGIGSVSATINSGLCQVVLPQKPVWVGTPSKPTSISGFCCNGKEFGSESIYEFTVVPEANQGADQYAWVVSGGTILEGQGTHTISMKKAIHW